MASKLSTSTAGYVPHYGPVRVVNQIALLTSLDKPGPLFLPIGDNTVTCTFRDYPIELKYKNGPGMKCWYLPSKHLMLSPFLYTTGAPIFL